MSQYQPPAPMQPVPVGPPPVKPGMSTGKVLLIVAGCVVGFFLLLVVGCTALVAGSMNAVSADPSESSQEEATEPASNAPAAKKPTSQAPATKTPASKVAPTTEAPKPQLKLSKSQENAISSARNYLEFKGFSRTGLIKQLSSRYADEFDKKDAEFAADFLEKSGEVDWKAEAVEAAQSYLEFKGFSCKGLVSQLTSKYADAFTDNQAEHAAKKVGLC